MKTATPHFLLPFFLLHFSFLIPLAPCHAQSGNWSAYRDDTFLPLPIQDTQHTITTPAQLARLAYLVNDATTNFHGHTFTIADSLDLGAHFWVPIGSGNPRPFAGTLTALPACPIHNLTINTTLSSAGLIGYTIDTATVSHLTLTNANITAENIIGAIVGYNNGTIAHCTVHATLASYNNVSVTGGIAGHNTGTIHTTITRGHISGNGNTGGIAGGNNGAILNAANHASVTQTGSRHTGGIAGHNTNGTIHNSINYGTITGSSSSSSYTGGIVGGNNSGAILNALNCGHITTANNPGAIAGCYGAATNCYATSALGLPTIGTGGATTDCATFDPTTLTLDTPVTPAGSDTTTADLLLALNLHAHASPLPLLPWHLRPDNLPALIIGSWSDEANRDLDWDHNTLTIATPQQLAQFAHLTSTTNFAGHTLTITAPLNLSPHLWVPAATNYANSFAGTLTALPGCHISGLTINDPTLDYAALIARNVGTLTHLTLTNTTITGRTLTAALTSHNRGTIDTCAVHGTIHGSGTTGGIVGGNSGHLLNSANHASVTATAHTPDVGGIAGYNTDGIIANSLNRGAIHTIATSANAGGIVGGNHAGAIFNSINLGPVTADTGYIGGIAGRYGFITNAYWLNPASPLPAANQYDSLSDCLPFDPTLTLSDSVTIAGTDTSDLLLALNLQVKATPTLATPAGDIPLLPWTLARSPDGYPVLDTATDNWAHPLNRDTTWDPSTGTIANAPQLAQFAWLVNQGANFAGVTILQTADIDLHGYNWTPAGDGVNYYFLGTFLGNGNAIANLTIDDATLTVAGLFGAVGNWVIHTGGHVQGVTLTNLYINGGNTVGGIAGYLGMGTVADCAVYGVITNAGDCVGGIVGRNDTAGGTVTGTRNAATVHGNDHVGGIAGQNYGVVINNENRGDVSGADHVGGIVGYTYGNVINNRNAGAVHGTDNAGGIAGYNDDVIKNCVNLGAVTGTGNVGSLVGYNDGGFGVIENSYWFDDGTAAVGNGNAAHASCYSFGAAPGTLDDATGTALGTALNDYVASNPTLGTISLATWTLHNSTDGYPRLLRADDFWSHARNRDTTWTYDGNAGATNFIANAAQFAQFAHLINSGADSRATTIITNAIDLSGKYWVPVGRFRGTLIAACANGLTEPTLQCCCSVGSMSQFINGLTINDPNGSPAGLIGIMESSATVSGIALTNLSINAKENIGGIAGENYGRIIDCAVHGVIQGAAAFDGGGSGITGIVGGIVGWNYGTIADSAFLGGNGITFELYDHTYTNVHIIGRGEVGGIAGANRNNAAIINCINLGNVAARSNSGGIAGKHYASSGNNATILNCINRGDISNVGGFGFGGIAGGIDAGDTDTATIANSVNLGTIFGHTLVASASGSGTSVTNSYWLAGTDLFNNGAVGGGVAIATDNSAFTLPGGELATPVTAGTITSTPHLLTALNAYVHAAPTYTDSFAAAIPLKHWTTVGSPDGSPRFRTADTPAPLISTTSATNRLWNYPAQSHLLPVTANCALHIHTTSPWLTLTPPSGTTLLLHGSTNLIIHAAENDTLTNRTATLTITALENPATNLTLTITQTAPDNWAALALRDTTWDPLSGTIANAHQLAQLAHLHNLPPSHPDRLPDGLHFTITQDIHLTGYTWIPIGNTARHFNATLTAHPDLLIHGLTITNTPALHNLALIHTLGTNSLLRGITLTNATVTGANHTALLTAHNFGTISNCLTHGTLTGQDYTAPLTTQNHGLITHSANHAATTGTGEFTAGIAAYNHNPISILGDHDLRGQIRHSSNHAPVTGHDHTGGICGKNDYAILNCSNHGAVLGTGYSTGGIAGQNINLILNSPNYGTVTGSSNTGGIIGQNYARLFNSPNHAQVTGADPYTGAIAGYNSTSDHGVLILNSHWSAIPGTNAGLNAVGANSLPAEHSSPYDASFNLLTPVLAGNITTTNLLSALNRHLLTPLHPPASFPLLPWTQPDPLLPPVLSPDHSIIAHIPLINPADPSLNRTLTHTNTLANLPIELVKGYTLDGWQTTTNAIPFNIYQATTLTHAAHPETITLLYTPHTYHVAYITTPGTTLTNTTHLYDVPFHLPHATSTTNPAPTLPSTSFPLTAWRHDATYHPPGALVSKLTALPNDTITLFAIWGSITNTTPLTLPDGTTTNRTTIINPDGTVTLDGAPLLNPDNSITLPDGTLLTPPPGATPLIDLHDGSITLPPGSTLTPPGGDPINLPDGLTLLPDNSLILPVTLDPSGGTVNPTTLPLTNTYANLPHPTRLGHTFLHWADPRGTPLTPATTFLDALYATALLAIWDNTSTPGGCDIPDGPSLAPAGTYHAYLYAPQPYADHSTTGQLWSLHGLLTLTISTSGRISAKLQTPDGNLPLSARTWTGLDPDNIPYVTLTHRNGWTLTAHASQGHLWGTAAAPSGATYTLDGLRNRFTDRSDTTAQTLLSSFARYYTLAILPDPLLSPQPSALSPPAGGGYLTLNVNKRTGTTRVAGRLPDGTTLSLSAPTLPYTSCGDLLALPLFRRLSAKKGTLGALLWLTPADENRATVTLDTDSGWFLRWHNTKSGLLTYHHALGFDYDKTTALLSPAGYLLHLDPVPIPYYPSGTDTPADFLNFGPLTNGIPLLPDARGTALTLPRPAPARATLRLNLRTGLYTGSFQATTDLPRPRSHRATYAGPLLQDPSAPHLLPYPAHALLPNTDPLTKKLLPKHSLPLWLTPQ